MNLTEIFQMQKKLDQAICQEHNVKSDEIIKQRILALIIEVAEFANELASFKYWKKNKVLKRDKMLEEFIDGIHFFASLALQLKIDSTIKPKINTLNMNEQLLSVFDAVTNLNKKFNEKNLQNSFSLYLGLGKLCEFEEEEIKNFYIEKNKINYQRIANNY